MLIHLIETGRHRAWHYASTFWSAGAHAALVVGVIVGALPARDDATNEVDREVVYLLPALPSAPRRPVDGALSFRGDDQGLHTRQTGAGQVVAGGERRADTSIEPVRAPVIPVVIDSIVQAGSPVYVAADLDRVVERDATSAAPAYPVELEEQQVEGAVGAEWVVDSTGHADTTSFRVVYATHPGFINAVRSALPLMHFRPAELLGHRVAQMVRQEFMFRIKLPAPDSGRGARP